MASSTIPGWRRALAILRPSHRHSTFTATLLLMTSALTSKVIGLVRVKYTAWLLGTSGAADAFNAAFQLPDMISYFLVGGAGSIVFISMLSRYREEGRDVEAERALSVILTTVILVLGAAIAVGEFLAPQYVKLLLHGFEKNPTKAALCVHLTRILLPAQLCFFASGVFAAFLLVRKHFSIQALTPLVYNLGTILGGVFFAKQIGVSSLAIGTVAGALCGPLLLNAIGACRAGMRYRPALDWSNPGLHEWIRMSIPLMLGVSLVSADNWIINYFASRVGGAITLLTYAKQIFSAPVALGQAAGAAGLPFLAGLFRKPDREPFTRAVNSSVSRILAFSFLLSAFMIAMGFPLVDVLFRGGQFHRADTETMGMYFAIFSVPLCLWSAQAIYARAFYAAGNTVTPMVAGTIVTAVSIPVYWALARGMGPVGLAVASDIGILLQTSALALLLHRRRMVSLAGLEYPELARSLVAALVSFAALAAIRSRIHTTSRLHEMALLAGATLIWLGTAILTLRCTGSSLPSQLMERLGLRA
jgi:putative peptidoglycan lipid II flippase